MLLFSLFSSDGRSGRLSNVLPASFLDIVCGQPALQRPSSAMGHQEGKAPISDNGPRESLHAPTRSGNGEGFMVDTS
jgi:hypothetical protein